MIRLIKAYLEFSRAERLGIAVLGILLLLLVVVRCTLGLWVRPAGADAALQLRMALAYEAWKLAEHHRKYAAASPDGAPLFEPFAFDPNTLDSAGFIRLGMPVRAVRGLLNWRRKGKRFHRPEDLKPLYNLPENVYRRLLPYIHIAGTEPADGPSRLRYGSPEPVPDVIDLNTADSALLDRGINGIGATLARKIVARREALGGYLSVDQLLEVYRFPDTTFQRMRERLRVDPGRVRKLPLNAASLGQLSAHPYIGEQTARNILLYREGIVRYERIEQLRQVPLMREEIYRKIAPYFTVD